MIVLSGTNLLQRHYGVGREQISYQDGVDPSTGARIVVFRLNGYNVVITKEELLMDFDGVVSRVGTYLGREAREKVGCALGFFRETERK